MSKEMEQNGEYISRQTAVQAIEKYFGFLPIQGRHDILEIINNLPSAQQWIPVKKRTPGIKMDHPHTDNYFVTYDSGDVGVAGWTNRNPFWRTAITSPYWKTAPHCEVIAWMPLPKPWEGETDG